MADDDDNILLDDILNGKEDNTKIQNQLNDNLGLGDQNNISGDDIIEDIENGVQKELDSINNNHKEDNNENENDDKNNIDQDINENQNKAKEEKEKEKEKDKEKENEQNKKEGNNSDYEKSLEIYNKLRKYLISTCIKIEENFNKIYSPDGNNNNQDMATLQNKNEEDDKENEEILKKIKEYQQKTKELQKQVELIMKMNNINELEGNLEIKNKYLSQLVSENKSLKKVTSIQDKVLNDYNDATIKRQELITIMEKTKKIKEEIKIKKDYLKLTDNKIKGQMLKIKELEQN